MAQPDALTWLGPPPPARPARVVSLVPSLTEWLAALGMDRETVGVTRFCVHPAGWKARKTIVGGTKNVDVERTLALRPDVVVASREENVRDQVEALAAAGVSVALTDIATVGGALATLRALADALGRGAEGARLADGIAGRFRALAEGGSAEGGSAEGARPRVLYLIWREPWMAAGGDTYISDVLAHGGLDNVLATRDRYPALADGDLAALRPDAVLLSSEPYPFAETHRAEVQRRAPDARVLLVDGEAFSWYGPRMASAPAALAAVRRALAVPNGA